MCLRLSPGRRRVCEIDAPVWIFNLLHRAFDTEWMWNRLFIFLCLCWMWDCLSISISVVRDFFLIPVFLYRTFDTGWMWSCLFISLCHCLCVSICLCLFWFCLHRAFNTGWIRDRLFIFFVFVVCVFICLFFIFTFASNALCSMSNGRCDIKAEKKRRIRK